jgi:hypothetical protein
MVRNFVSPAYISRIETAKQEGYQFEKDFFGISSKHDHRKGYHDDGWITFKEGLSETIRRQNVFRWDPRRPHTAFARNIFKAVKDSMSQKINGELFLYCAIDTALDREFGIDGFFVFENNFQFLVTFDLARSDNWHKRKSLKADILVTKGDMLSNRKVREIGQAISGRFMTAINRKNKKIKKMKEKKYRREMRNKKRRIGYSTLRVSA